MSTYLVAAFFVASSSICHRFWFYERHMDGGSHYDFFLRSTCQSLYVFGGVALINRQPLAPCLPSCLIHGLMESIGGGGLQKKGGWAQVAGFGFKNFRLFFSFSIRRSDADLSLRLIPPPPPHFLATFMSAFVSPLRHFGIKFILYEFMGQKAFPLHANFHSHFVGGCGSEALWHCGKKKCRTATSIGGCGGRGLDLNQAECLQMAISWE